MVFENRHQATRLGGISGLERLGQPTQASFNRCTRSTLRIGVRPSSSLWACLPVGGSYSQTSTRTYGTMRPCWTSRTQRGPRHHRFDRSNQPSVMGERPSHHPSRFKPNFARLPNSVPTWVEFPVSVRTGSDALEKASGREGRRRFSSRQPGTSVSRRQRPKSNPPFGALLCR
jgi:hypothetical protein